MDTVNYFIAKNWHNWDFVASVIVPVITFIWA